MGLGHAPHFPYILTPVRVRSIVKVWVRDETTLLTHTLPVIVRFR